MSEVDNDGFCIGQVKTAEKSTEMKAIPELLENLNIERHIITTDAAGTYPDIVKKTRKKKADYVLALKVNQEMLLDDVKLHFEDTEFRRKCTYHRTIEKARSGVEQREYCVAAA